RLRRGASVMLAQTARVKARCRICGIAIVPGEDVLPDPAAYWASPRKIHAVCRDNPDNATRDDWAEARADSVTSRHLEEAAGLYRQCVASTKAGVRCR